MALGLNPSHALLNDANPYLINFYGWLQSGWEFDPRDLIDDTKENYLRIRDEFNAARSHETLDDAKRFYLLNRMAHKGMFRVNKSGAFNTAYGYRNLDTIPIPNVKAYQHQIEHWTFTCGSYADITRHDDDFLYVDPPYDTEFTGYTTDCFSWDDQVAVAQWCASHPGPVVLCNQATPRIVALYTELGFTLTHTKRLERMRMTQGDSAEVIALRNLTYPNQSLF
jgi:DNA adenine methylase